MAAYWIVDTASGCGAQLQRRLAKLAEQLLASLGLYSMDVITTWHAFSLQMQELPPDVELTDSPTVCELGDTQVLTIKIITLQNATQGHGFACIVWNNPCNGKWP